MHKYLKNEKGFSLVELLIILVVIVLLALVGYMVYKNHHKSPSGETTNTNIYTGWKTYSSSTFTFKYSPSWQINQGSAAQPYMSLTSKESAIDSFASKTPFYQSSIEDVNLNLFSKPPYYPVSCLSATAKCTVKAVEPLSINGVTNSKLVLYSEGNASSQCPSGNSESCTSFVGDEFEVISSSTEKVGDLTVPLGLTLNGRLYQLVGCLQTGTKNSDISSQNCSSINNVAAFEDSTDYKNLIQTLNSLTIN